MSEPNDISRATCMPPHASAPSSPSRLVAIIPAYEPDHTLIDLVDGLHICGFSDIIVIDDGSGDAYHLLFEALEGTATVLHHPANCGKGFSIKTALRHLMLHSPGPQVVVAVDCDGQHRPEDARLVARRVIENPEALVLGVRTFGPGTPLRSLLGNRITTGIFRLVSGRWVADTQTGLRGFSSTHIPALLDIPGSRYEYEMNMLLTAARRGRPIVEQPIATIYHDTSNTCSHFHSIRDSARIYHTLLAFAAASFLSFLIDYALFGTLTFLLTTALPAATVLVASNVGARMVSAAFNYHLNREHVFRSKAMRSRSVLQYVCLACGILTLNTLILFALVEGVGLNALVAKVLTEMLLFTLSYLVQRHLIFRQRDSSAPDTRISDTPRSTRRIIL